MLYPTIPSSSPEGPWRKIAINFMEFNNYYSRFIEIVKVHRPATRELIARCREIFAQYGIPIEVFSDLGTQFTSAEWKEFAKSYGFNARVSSPHYHRGNGEAERAVKTVKTLLQKNTDDPALALFTYRATPNVCGLSTSELLMGRRLRTRLPLLPEQLQPKVIDHDDFYAWSMKNWKNKQKPTIVVTLSHQLNCHLFLEHAYIFQIARGRNHPGVGII